MTDNIDHDAIRHAFAALDETAAWLDATATTLQRHQDDPLYYDEANEELRLEGWKVEQLRVGVEACRDNIRGAVSEILGRGGAQ